MLKLKPFTIWSIWSMLRKTMSTNNNINIAQFLKLKDIVKSNAKGYKPKQSLALNWSNIEYFMNEAPDETYSGTKVK